MTDLHVTVIIPSTLKMAQRPFLRQAIASIEQQKKRSHWQITICVVSTSQPSRTFKNEFKHVRFIQAPPNSGFADLNNTAVSFLLPKVRMDHSGWLLLLNDDAWIAENFFEQLALEEEKSRSKRQPAVYAPVMLEAADPTQIDVFGVEYFRSGYAKNCRDRKIPTTLATAGCMLLRWEFVEKLIERYGYFFNPIYYYYLEDVDLSIRILMSSGEIKKAEQLIAYHHGSVSSGGRRNTFALYQTYRNILWVLICCWPGREILRNVLNILLVQAWVLIYGSWSCGILTYPRIWGETVWQLPRLLEYRKITLRGYNDVRFDTLLAPYNFRTYHNTTIPAL
ncbi:glycosyltransferase family 2 protein [Patescibacteria group bacterium]|nr:glycosyltransferase family 2 protein [Patescibacteria group bacterium]